MKTASPELIARNRALGWWGDATAWSLLEGAVAAAPQGIALLDPPNRAALVGGEPQRIDWQGLRAAALALASRLAGEGVGRDDVVLTQFPNTVESVIALLGITALGAMASPVPMPYGRHELSGIAALLKPRAFLSIPDFRGNAHCAVQAAAFPDAVRCLPFSCADAWGAHATPVAVDADEVFTICWTSGTTGTPKGVPRSHNQWLAQTVAVNGMGVEPGMRMLCPFPLVNMASLSGFFFPWLQCRGTLALHHPLELPVFLGQLQAERIEYTVVPPALLNMLLKQPALLAAHDLSALRIVASGSAPLAPWMVRGFQEEHGIEVVNVFGSNEGVSLLSSALDVPEPEKRAALFPRFGVEGIHWKNPVSARIRTRLVDPQSGEVVDSPGQTGELQVRGPNVFDGYFAAPEDNRRAFTEDGFFRSGDLFEIATQDPRFYRFVGRCKDIIVRGGMKISPEELDTLLAGHPMLAEVAVAPYPDEVLGERICAVVVPRPGQAPVLADVVSWLEAQGIARIKLPERLVVVEALPRNPLGKLLRHELAALLRS